MQGPIKIIDGKASIDVSKPLSKQKQFILSRLMPVDQKKYLLSLLGIMPTRVPLALRSSRNMVVDRLATRGKGLVQSMSLAAKNLSSSHFPLKTLSGKAVDQGHWIGVEIECFVPWQTDENDNLMDGDNYSCKEALKSAIRARKISLCQVKEDGSLSSESGAPVEVTLLYNSKHGHEKLEKLCEALAEVGAFVNSTCGLHVHLDARHLDSIGAKAMAKRLGFALPVLAKMQPQSRRNNSYCRLGVSGMDGERYYAINATAYNKYKTIECRLHAGSVSFEKISKWVDLLRFLSRSELVGTVNTYQSLIDETSMPDALVGYVERRLRRHAPEMLEVTQNEAA